MSDTFLEQSARHDANDLRSVVSAGGRWCICAWAWASAVQRDPRRYEGITLECERTNQKLRDVYQSFIASGADLHSPSGACLQGEGGARWPSTGCAGVGGAGAGGGAVVAGGRRRAGGGAVRRARAPPWADARLAAAAADARRQPGAVRRLRARRRRRAAGLVAPEARAPARLRAAAAKERETLNAGAVASDVPTTPTTEAVVVDGVKASACWSACVCLCVCL